MCGREGVQIYGLVRGSVKVSERVSEVCKENM